MNGYPIFCRVFCGKDGDSSWRVPEGLRLQRSLLSTASDPIPLIHRFAKLLSLFWRHTPAASTEAAAARAARSAVAESSEQDSAQGQQPQSLPEAKRSPAKQRRQQPIPQVHHHFAADKEKQRDSNNCERNDPVPFSSHVLFLTFDSLRAQ